MKRLFFLTMFSLFGFVALFGQYKSKYPDIPIVDVHIHPGWVDIIGLQVNPANGENDVANLFKVSEVIKQKYGSNLAFWIGLGDPGEAADAIKAACNNRILFAMSQMNPHRGLTITADEVIAKVKNDGYVGLKIWFGPAYRVLLKEGEEGITRIDDPRFESFFAALNREKVLMTSLHIADPNLSFDVRREERFSGKLNDPVYYWEQIRAFENVVAKYPDITFVAAHFARLHGQDAQIDYLRYMLSTYPNLHIDLSATSRYVHFTNHENLRDFYIEYQDRILYGSDCLRVADNLIENFAIRYAKFFAFMETDLIQSCSLFDNTPTKGLDLPREVLEKIYYKNALKLYPGLKKAMGL